MSRTHPIFKLQYFLIASFLMAGGLSIKAQQNSNALVHPAKYSDTGFINTILNKAALLRESNPNSTLLLYQQALSASNKANYRRGKALSLQGLGRYYSYKNEQEKSLSYLRLALPYYENNKEGYEQEVSTYILMSENFYYAGRYDSCAFYRYEALNQLEAYRVLRRSK